MITLKKLRLKSSLINEAMKRVEEAEKTQCAARNCRDYEKAQNEAKDANIDLMNAVEEIVRLASAMGCASGLYDIHKYHRVVELDFRDSHK